MMISYKGTVPLAVILSLNLFACASPPSEKEPELDGRAYNGPKGNVVYAVKDISEGTVINLDDLTEREILLSRIPEDSMRSSADVAGRVAKYGISSGQIISRHDLAPDTKQH